MTVDTNLFRAQVHIVRDRRENIKRKLFAVTGDTLPPSHLSVPCLRERARAFIILFLARPSERGHGQTDVSTVQRTLELFHDVRRIRANFVVPIVIYFCLRNCTIWHAPSPPHPISLSRISFSTCSLSSPVPPPPLPRSLVTYIAMGATGLARDTVRRITALINRMARRK